MRTVHLHVFSLNAHAADRRWKWKDGLLPVRDFYLGPGKVDLRQGDDAHPHCDHSCKRICRDIMDHYIKYSMRNAMDIATLSCSVVSRGQILWQRVLEDVRITFGVAALRCRTGARRQKRR